MLEGFVCIRESRYHLMFKQRIGEQKLGVLLYTVVAGTKKERWEETLTAPKSSTAYVTFLEIFIHPSTLQKAVATH